MEIRKKRWRTELKKARKPKTGPAEGSLATGEAASLGGWVGREKYIHKPDTDSEGGCKTKRSGKVRKTPCSIYGKPERQKRRQTTRSGQTNGKKTLKTKKKIIGEGLKDLLSKETQGEGGNDGNRGSTRRRRLQPVRRTKTLVNYHSKGGQKGKGARFN